jgi:hypothetical protein
MAIDDKGTSNNPDFGQEWRTKRGCWVFCVTFEKFFGCRMGSDHHLFSFSEVVFIKSAQMWRWRRA